jgi:hypothetical protein
MIKKYKEFISEGLIRTYDIKKTVKYLNSIAKTLSIPLGDIIISDGSNADDDEDGNKNFSESIFIKFTNVNINSDDIRKLIKGLDICGYFPSMFGYYDNDNQSLKKSTIYHVLGNNDNIDYVLNLGYPIVQIECEARFNTKIEDLENTLYHLTNRKYLDNILKKGLRSRTESKKAYHPERIYMGKTKEDCMNLLYQLDKNVIWSLIKVDITKLQITIFQDPDYDDGVYCDGTIEPSRLSVIYTDARKEI